jgi:hypothetical protein
MSETPYSVIFRKVAEETTEEDSDTGLLEICRSLSADLDEISELRRVVEESAVSDELVFYTV